MKYFDNTSVRRQDRLMGASETQALLEGGEYGFLAIGGPEAYGIPLNYVFTESAIYFHCAPEGEKLRRIAVNPQVSFCVVGRTQPLAAKFTTEYESVLVKGRLTILSDEGECMRALELILDKYSPDHKEMGMAFTRASYPRTRVLRLDIEQVSAKCKRVGP